MGKASGSQRSASQESACVFCLVSVRSFELDVLNLIKDAR
jgi:hypothetical protein